MNKYVKIGIFGFFIWLIPFIVSIGIYPLHESNHPLFESIMPVVISLCVVIFTVLYFRKIDKEFISEGVFIGIKWFFISLIIDLILFLPESPMHMSFAEYMMDIGVTYLLIPVITIGYGYALGKRS